MRNKVLIFLLLSILSTPARAQDLPPRNDKRFIGAAMDYYATIAGGWYLEKKCHFMDEVLLKEYEARITLITPGMHKVLGVDKNVIYQMQRAGKTTAERWECNDKSRDVVVHTVIMARKLGDAIYKPEEKTKP